MTIKIEGLQGEMVVEDDYKFTPRQREVLQCRVLGYNTAEIARRMGISVKTVDEFTRQITERMGEESAFVGIPRAIVLGVKRGLLDISSLPTEPKESLSKREQEIFDLLGHGAVVRSQLADGLFISESTATTHLGRIYHKYGIHGFDQLVAIAARDARRSVDK